MDREIHIWLDRIGWGEYDNDSYLCKTIAETEVMLECKKTKIVHTTQPHYCQFRYGKIFVHIGGKMYEITIGDCDGTNREIREGHNLEQMLFSGEFSWF